MNKLISKIVGACLGLSLATGVCVGVAVGQSEIKEVNAATETLTFSFSTVSGGFKTDSDITKNTLYQTTSDYNSLYTLNYMNSYQNSEYTYLMLGSKKFTSTALLSNKTAIPGNITKITINPSSGCSTSATWCLSLGTAELKTSFTTGQKTSTGKASFNYSASESSNYRYFGVCSTSTSYNAQIGSIVVEYAGSSSATLSNISVGGAMTKTSYLTSDSWDPTGLTVTATYSDSTTRDVTSSSSWTYSPLSPSSTTTTSVRATASYTESGVTKTAYKDVAVTVSEPAVTGVFELYTGSIATGDYVFMSADANYTYVMGNTISSNRATNGSPTPSVSSNKITNPSNDFIWHVAKSGNYWTIKNAANDKYLAGTSSKNQAALLDSASSDLAKWEISYSDGWVLHNYGRSLAASDSGNAYLKNNTTSGWACYASSFGTAPALFKLPSTDPAIDVTVTGETSLKVGETATLTATKINGATGTVNWATSDSSKMSISAAAGDSITVTAVAKGSATITASLTGCDDVTVSFTISNGNAAAPYSVAEARAAIDANEGITDVYTTGIIYQIDSIDTETYFNATYWISDDGTDSAPLEIFRGKYLNEADFTSGDEIGIGDTVTVRGTLKKYGSTYEYDAGNYIISLTKGEITLASITGIDGTLTAVAGASSWDLSTLTPKGTLSTSSSVVDISQYVDLTTSDAVPSSAGSTTISVTVAPKDTGSSVQARSFNVSASVIVPTGPIPSGRYYIMNSTKTYALNAVESTAIPAAVDVSVSNNLVAFDVVLVGDNSYSISTTVNDTKYYLVNNSNAESGSNSSIRVVSNPLSTLKSTTWSLNNTGVETDGAYYVTQNTVGNVLRYLSQSESQQGVKDWRGYVNTNTGDPEIQFVPEGSYAEVVANMLLDDLTCNDGVTAPSTTVWDNIDSAFTAITISGEKAFLTGGTADEDSESAIEQALAKYDYIIGKYGTENYTNFLNRNVSGARLMNNGIETDSAAIPAIVVVITLVTISAGAYFLLRKKKEN